MTVQPEATSSATDSPPDVWWRRGVAVGLFIFGLAVLLFSLAAVASLAIGPRLQRDQDLLNRYLQLSRPGYLQVATLGHEPGSNAANRRLRIEAIVDTPGAPIKCQGLFIYHHQPSPAWDLAWDSTACAQADETIRLARRILDGGSLRHTIGLYGGEQTVAVQALLQHWLQNGTISAADIPGADNRLLLQAE